MEIVVELKVNYHPPGEEVFNLVKQFNIIEHIGGSQNEHLQSLIDTQGVDLLVKTHRLGEKYGLVFEIAHSDVDNILWSYKTLEHLYEEMSKDLKNFLGAHCRENEVIVTFGVLKTRCSICNSEMKLCIEDFLLHVQRHKNSSMEESQEISQNPSNIAPGLDEKHFSDILSNVSKAIEHLKSKGELIDAREVNLAQKEHLIESFAGESSKKTFPFETRRQFDIGCKSTNSSLNEERAEPSNAGSSEPHHHEINRTDNINDRAELVYSPILSSPEDSNDSNSSGKEESAPDVELNMGLRKLSKQVEKDAARCTDVNVKSIKNADGNGSSATTVTSLLKSRERDLRQFTNPEKVNRMPEHSDEDSSDGEIEATPVVKFSTDSPESPSPARPTRRGDSNHMRPIQKNLASPASVKRSFSRDLHRYSKVASPKSKCLNEEGTVHAVHNKFPNDKDYRMDKCIGYSPQSPPPVTRRKSPSVSGDRFNSRLECLQDEPRRSASPAHHDRYGDSLRPQHRDHCSEERQYDDRYPGDRHYDDRYPGDRSHSNRYSEERQYGDRHNRDRYQTNQYSDERDRYPADQYTDERDRFLDDQYSDDREHYYGDRFRDERQRNCDNHYPDERNYGDQYPEEPGRNYGDRYSRERYHGNQHADGGYYGDHTSDKDHRQYDNRARDDLKRSRWVPYSERRDGPAPKRRRSRSRSRSPRSSKHHRHRSRNRSRSRSPRGLRPRSPGRTRTRFRSRSWERILRPPPLRSSSSGHILDDLVKTADQAILQWSKDKASSRSTDPKQSHTVLPATEVTKESVVTEKNEENTCGESSKDFSEITDKNGNNKTDSSEDREVSSIMNKEKEIIDAGSADGSAENKSKSEVVKKLARVLPSPKRDENEVQRKERESEKSTEKCNDKEKEIQLVPLPDAHTDCEKPSSDKFDTSKPTSAVDGLKPTDNVPPVVLNAYPMSQQIFCQNPGNPPQMRHPPPYGVYLPAGSFPYPPPLNLPPPLMLPSLLGQPPPPLRQPLVPPGTVAAMHRLPPTIPRNGLRPHQPTPIQRPRGPSSVNNNVAVVSPLHQLPPASVLIRQVPSSNPSASTAACLATAGPVAQAGINSKGQASTSTSADSTKACPNIQSSAKQPESVIVAASCSSAQASSAQPNKSSAVSTPERRNSSSVEHSEPKLSKNKQYRIAVGEPRFVHHYVKWVNALVDDNRIYSKWHDPNNTIQDGTTKVVVTFEMQSEAHKGYGMDEVEAKENAAAAALLETNFCFKILPRELAATLKETGVTAPTVNLQPASPKPILRTNQTQSQATGANVQEAVQARPFVKHSVSFGAERSAPKVFERTIPARVPPPARLSINKQYRINIDNLNCWGLVEELCRQRNLKCDFRFAKGTVSVHLGNELFSSDVGPVTDTAAAKQLGCRRTLKETRYSFKTVPEVLRNTLTEEDKRAQYVPPAVIPKPVAPTGQLSYNKQYRLSMDDPKHERMWARWFKMLADQTRVENTCKYEKPTKEERKLKQLGYVVVTLGSSTKKYNICDRETIPKAMNRAIATTLMETGLRFRRVPPELAGTLTKEDRNPSRGPKVVVKAHSKTSAEVDTDEPMPGIRLSKNMQYNLDLVNPSPMVLQSAVEWVEILCKHQKATDVQAEYDVVPRSAFEPPKYRLVLGTKVFVLKLPVEDDDDDEDDDYENKIELLKEEMKPRLALKALFETDFKFSLGRIPTGLPLASAIGSVGSFQSRPMHTAQVTTSTSAYLASKSAPNTRPSATSTVSVIPVESPTKYKIPSRVKPVPSPVISTPDVVSSPALSKNQQYTIDINTPKYQPFLVKWVEQLAAQNNLTSPWDDHKLDRNRFTFGHESYTACTGENAKLVRRKEAAKILMKTSCRFRTLPENLAAFRNRNSERAGSSSLSDSSVNSGCIDLTSSKKRKAPGDNSATVGSKHGKNGEGQPKKKKKRKQLKDKHDEDESVFLFPESRSKIPAATKQPAGPPPPPKPQISRNKQYTVEVLNKIKALDMDDLIEDLQEQNNIKCELKPADDADDDNRWLRLEVQFGDETYTDISGPTAKQAQRTAYIKILRTTKYCFTKLPEELEGTLPKDDDENSSNKDKPDSSSSTKTGKDNHDKSDKDKYKAKSRSKDGSNKGDSSSKSKDKAKKQKSSIYKEIAPVKVQSGGIVEARNGQYRLKMSDRKELLKSAEGWIKRLCEQNKIQPTYNSVDPVYVVFGNEQHVWSEKFSGKKNNVRFDEMKIETALQALVSTKYRFRKVPGSLKKLRVAESKEADDSVIHIRGERTDRSVIVLDDSVDESTTVVDDSRDGKTIRPKENIKLSAAVVEYKGLNENVNQIENIDRVAARVGRKVNRIESSSDEDDIMVTSEVLSREARKNRPVQDIMANDGAKSTMEVVEASSSSASQTIGPAAIEEVESPPVLCSTHLIVCVVYCQTCKQKICVQCSTGDHQMHTTTYNSQLLEITLPKHSENNQLAREHVVALSDEELFKLVKKLAKQNGVECSYVPFSSSMTLRFGSGFYTDTSVRAKRNVALKCLMNTKYAFKKVPKIARRGPVSPVHVAGSDLHASVNGQYWLDKNNSMMKHWYVQWVGYLVEQNQLEANYKWNVLAAGVGVIKQWVIMGEEKFEFKGTKEQAAEHVLLNTKYKFSIVPELLLDAPWMPQSDSDSEESGEDTTVMDTTPSNQTQAPEEHRGTVDIAEAFDYHRSTPSAEVTPVVIMPMDFNNSNTETALNRMCETNVNTSVTTQGANVIVIAPQAGSDEELSKYGDESDTLPDLPPTGIAPVNTQEGAPEAVNNLEMAPETRITEILPVDAEMCAPEAVEEAQKDNDVFVEPLEISSSVKADESLKSRRVSSDSHSDGLSRSNSGIDSQSDSLSRSGSGNDSRSGSLSRSNSGNDSLCRSNSENSSLSRSNSKNGSLSRSGSGNDDPSDAGQSSGEEGEIFSSDEEGPLDESDCMIMEVPKTPPTVIDIDEDDDGMVEETEIRRKIAAAKQCAHRLSNNAQYTRFDLKKCAKNINWEHLINVLAQQNGITRKYEKLGNSLFLELGSEIYTESSDALNWLYYKVLINTNYAFTDLPSLPLRQYRPQLDCCARRYVVVNCANVLKEAVKLVQTLAAQNQIKLKIRQPEIQSEGENKATIILGTEEYFAQAVGDGDTVLGMAHLVALQRTTYNFKYLPNTVSFADYRLAGYTRLLKKRAFHFNEQDTKQEMALLSNSLTSEEQREITKRVASVNEGKQLKEGQRINVELEQTCQFLDERIVSAITAAGGAGRVVNPHKYLTVIRMQTRTTAVPTTPGPTPGPAALDFAPVGRPAALDFTPAGRPAALDFAQAGRPAALNFAQAGRPAALNFAPAGRPAALDFAQVGGPAALNFAQVGGPAALNFAQVGGPAALNLTAVGRPATLDFASLGFPVDPDFAPVGRPAAQVPRPVAPVTRPVSLPVLPLFKPSVPPNDSVVQPVVPSYVPKDKISAKKLSKRPCHNKLMEHLNSWNNNQMGLEEAKRTIKQLKKSCSGEEKKIIGHLLNLIKNTVNKKTSDDVRRNTRNHVALHLLMTCRVLAGDQFPNHHVDLNKLRLNIK